MSLRNRLFLLPALAIAAAAALVAVGSERYARGQFEQADRQRTQTLVAQFQRELTQRGDEVVRAVQNVADAEATLRMAMELSQPQADPSVYVNDARGLANIYHLDFLELSSGDGTLISSTDWRPASGYRNDWVTKEADWNHQGAFLNRVQLPDNVALGLLAVRTVRVGDRNLYVIGGWRFDRQFLQTMALPEGMRALLYASLENNFIPGALTGPEGPVAEADRFAPLIESVQHGETPQPRVIQWTSQATSAEAFLTVPLRGHGGEFLGALLVGSSQRDLAALIRYVRSLALVAAAGGILFGLVLSWWISLSVTRPLGRLTEAAREMQSGKPDTRAVRPDLRAGGITGPLAAALNDMTGRIARERERVLQAERASARREMARRFAQELKESIFPMHMAAEDMLNAREESSERFDEIFFESTTALRAELERLKSVAARFGEFSRVSSPRHLPVNVNEAARAALQAIEPKFRASERPPVTPEVHLGEPEPVIEADAEQIRAALENLFLHCLDAMPSGGTLSIRTREKDAVVRVEVSATSASLSPEECARLFAIHGSAPASASGLGLATTQAVVIDHRGKISAESSQTGGTTFRLEFPAAPASVARPASPITARQVPVETARVTPLETARQAPSETTSLTPSKATRPASPDASRPAVSDATPPVSAVTASPAPSEVRRTTSFDTSRLFPMAASQPSNAQTIPESPMESTPVTEVVTVPVVAIDATQEETATPPQTDSN